MEPFIGQLQLFAFGFVPRGWVRCEGQLLQISQYQALFALLGTTFGGNGTTTFGLPDLRGRAAVGAGQMTAGSFYPLGQAGGLEGVQLTPDNLPAHNHMILATTGATNTGRPPGTLLGDTGAGGPAMYAPQSGSSPAALAAAAVAPAGESQRHENRQPYLTMTWAIALQGIWPSRD
ncbi:MAG TPA: tail fiber protein [Bryobacteraceae bacterium]|nr:tail fiber protein [Bryobacteraceae bacterium]